MKAMIFGGVGDLHVGDIPEPTLERSTDAIVRVTMSSICTSDLHIGAGAIPRAVPGIALGHEFVGVVEEVGADVKNVSVGDRVAVNCETYCGECFFCRHGWVNNCTDPAGGWALGCRIDGGQAERCRVPFADNCLTVIPDPVSDEKALLTGDLLSTGYWACDIAGMEEGHTVAVIGAGPTGLCCAMMAGLKGPADIVIVDVDETRLEFAREHGIGTAYVNPLRQDLEEELKGMTDGRGADVVLEVAGGSDTFECAWRAARPNATVVIVAMYDSPQTLPLPEMYGKNLSFRTGGVDGSHCGDIMDLIASGRVDASCLITHRFPFSYIEEAYDLFSDRRDGVMKVAINFINE